MIVPLLWFLTLSVVGLQLIYIIIFFRHIWGIASKADGILHRAAVPEYASRPLSVIICAHNEADHLSKFLQEVLEQQYHLSDEEIGYEVIVVNDRSTDDTAEVLARFADYPHLRVVTIPADAERSLPGKKFPLSKGLEAARYDWIVCTDADCFPSSDSWLHYMAAPLLAGKQIVAGYGSFIGSTGLLGNFIQYETVHTFLLYYSMTKAGLPYMAVGRNLAATKAAFLKAQQSEVWSRLPSGDDDLLVQISATKDNMAVLAHPASATRSYPKRTWKEYLRQKQRHVSTGKFYSNRTKLVLGAYALSHALWWALLIACVIFELEYAALSLVVSMVALLITFQYGAAYLRERTSIIGWLRFSLCWVLYNAVLAPYILWKTKQRWK